MPKNKKPAGGRPAKNFDPSYAKKKPGGPFRGTDSRRPFSRDERPAGRFDRDDRPRRFDRDERPAGRFDRDERAPRRFDGERPTNRFSRDERPAGRFNRDDRPAGRFNRDDRPARSFDGERPARRFDRDERPAGRFNRDDRPRRFDRDDRPARSFDGERPARRFDRDERPAGRFNRDDRPRRFDRDDRPARSFDGERPARRFDRDDRAPRRFDGDRPARRFDRDERPARTAAQEQHIDVVHERLEAQAVAATDVQDVTFAELGLGDNICRALADLGAVKPFPIQAATVKPILDGRDVLARGRTGSGKTIAFGAPLVEKVLRSKEGQRREFGRAPVALILAPTRELALQIDRTIQPIARSVGLFTTQIYGGVPQGRQVGALKKGVDIIIGTPGRIEDLQEQGKLDLSNIAITVLDEADHMCELGFLEPVQRILRLTAEGGQKLLFSATLDREVAALVDEFLVEPSVYEVAGEDQDSGTIDHRVLVIDQRSKGEILDQLVERDGKTLVFSRTRAYAEQLAEQFEDAGIAAVALHGDLNQAKRTRNIERFAKGRAQVLVATDVAARGIHVDDVDLVVQADAPTEYKTYLHRSGRTGRAGRSGRVVTLITRQRQRKMDDLLRRAEIDAPFDQVRPGDELIFELIGGPTAEELTA